jgi:hypothetical protein
MKYTPSGHSPIKVARVYLRVSTDEQDLTRQSEIEQSVAIRRLLHSWGLPREGVGCLRGPA